MTMRWRCQNFLDTGSDYQDQGEGTVRGVFYVRPKNPPPDEAQRQGGRMGPLVSLRCPVGSIGVDPIDETRPNSMVVQ